MVHPLKPLLTAAVLLTTTAIATAQELTVVNDEPPLAGFPQDTVLDIQGIAPGMTPDQVRSAHPADYDEDQTRIFVANSDTGAQFELEYMGQLSTLKEIRGQYAYAQIDHFDGVEVDFGSQAVGGRAIEILRNFKPEPENPISREAFRQLLIEKYGEPSVTSLKGEKMWWLYSSTEQIMMKSWPETAFLDTQTAEFPVIEDGELVGFEEAPIPTCWFAFNQNLVEGLFPYEHVSNREILDRECTGGMVVTLGYGEDVDQVTFLVIDHRRRLLNAEELDRVIEDRLAKDSGQSNAPEL